MSKSNEPPSVDAFLAQVEAEDRDISLRAFNRVVFLAGFVFLAPTVFLDSVGGAYDPWIRASHLILAAAGFLFAWLTRAGSRLSADRQAVLAPIYVIGVNLSQLILVQRLREPLDVTPALLTVVVLALIDMPIGWFVATAALQVLSIFAVATSVGWRDPWISVGLVTMAVVAVFAAVYVSRREHRLRIQRLRAEQLASNAALEREMDERTRLQEREIANEKLQSLGRLAGGVAHDLNNLLVPIIGNVDLLMQEDLTRDQHEGLKRVMEAAERAGLLTRRLTAYAGKGGAADEVFDLAREVSETRELVLRTVPTPCTISWVPPSDPVWIAGDRAQVQQALLNLMINAAEAVQDHPEAAVYVRLAAPVPGPDDDPGPFASLEVRDEGLGIVDEDLRRVFDPFFTTKGSGRGLGLSAALGAAQRQGGRLVARNSEGGGARFTLFLRYAGNPPETTPPLGEPSPRPGRVLLVDDDQPVRDVARQILESAGYEVLACPSGPDACTVAEGPTALDVAIVDLRMPGMSGRETIARLRQTRPDLPVLICTGYGAEAAGWSDSLKNVELIAKPYRGKALVSAVRELEEASMGTQRADPAAAV